MIDIVANNLRVEKEKVTADKSFTKDLGADSLDVVELVMELEEEFSIEEIPEDEAKKIITVGDAIAYLDKKVEEKIAI